jgi:hypothetical protein
MYLPTHESDFRTWLTTAIRGADGFVQTIETTTKAGVPDLYFVLGGIDAWLELKVGHQSGPLIRKEQRIWGMKHAKSGGKSFFLYYNKTACRLMLYANPVDVVCVYGKYLRIEDAPIDTALPSVHELRQLLIRNLI